MVLVEAPLILDKEIESAGAEVASEALVNDVPFRAEQTLVDLGYTELGIVVALVVVRC